jgi:hypothetical protein
MTYEYQRVVTNGHKKAAQKSGFFKYVSDYASAMMITLIEVITSE